MRELLVAFNSLIFDLLILLKKILLMKSSQEL
jgi:hypothetical protein